MATYYVDSVAGSDASDGLSEGTAWQTFANVSGASFAAGDSVLFKRGGLWREQLNLPSGGTSGARVTLGAYGTGADPTIKGSDVVTGWTSEAVGGFTAYFKGGFADDPRQVFADGARMLEVDAKVDLVADSWWWDSANSRVYVRTSGDDAPSGYTIEVSVRVNAILCHGKSYVTVTALAMSQARRGAWVQGGSTDITFDACVFEYAGDRGYGSDHSAPQTGLLVDGCTARYCLNHGIYFGDGTQSSTVRNSTAHDCGQEHTRYDFVSGFKAFDATCSNNTWEDNLSYHHGYHYYTGAAAPGSTSIAHGYWVDAVGTGWTIRRNIAHGNVRSGYHIEKTAGSLCHHNISYNNGKHGYQFSNTAGINYVPQENNEAYHNVAYDNTEWGFLCKGVDSGATVGSYQNNTLQNNIAFGNGLGSLYASWGAENDGTAGSGNVYTYNCFGPEAANFIEWGRGGPFHDTYAAWEAAAGAATAGNWTSGDPLFTDAAGADFTLQAGSPCIDAGLAVAGINDGFGGTAPDLGAFETADGGGDPEPDPLHHAVRYRPQGGAEEDWVVLVQDTTALSDSIAVLDNGTWEIQSGGYVQGEGIGCATWGDVVTFSLGLPVAEFDLSATGHTVTATDRSTTPEGTEITTWAWRYWLTSDPGTILGTSSAQNWTFIAGADGQYTVELTVTNDAGLVSAPHTETLTLGAGSTAPPYSLPTQRYAGEFLIELDPTIDWTGNPNVILATDGSAWIDWNRALTAAGVRENRVISRSVTDHADQPVQNLRATLHMNTGAGSISSGAVNSWFNNLAGSFSPALFGKRRVLWQIPLGDPLSTDPADFEPFFWGRVDQHPANHAGDVSLFARDLSADLMIPYAREPVWIGTQGQLVSLEDAIQLVLDAATSPGEWVLKYPAEGSGFAFPAFELTPQPDVLSYIRQLAQQKGSVVRWWPDATTGRPQLTLFVLQVDKAAPDFTYTASEHDDIPGHGSDTTTYRNDFTLFYLPPGETVPRKVTRAATAAEIESFGYHPLVIPTTSTRQITTDAEAQAMLSSIVDALAVPATVGERSLPFEPGIAVNSLLRLGADARVSQEDVDLYVTGWTTYERAIGTDKYESGTTASLRGAPVGRIAAWLASIREGATQVVTGPGGETGDQVEPLHWDTDTHSTVSTATAWLKLTGNVASVTTIRFRHRYTADEWSEPASPTRGPGSASVAKGGTLAAGEYEYDMLYSGNPEVTPKGELTLDSGDIQAVAYTPIDPDAVPRITGASVEGQDIVTTFDDDTNSLHFEHSGGTWTHDADVTGLTSYRVTVPVDPGATWPIQITAYSTLVANRGDPGELSAVWPSLVNVSAPDVADAMFKEFSVTAPAIGNSEMTITWGITGSVAGRTVRVLSRDWIGKAFKDVTNELSPPPNPPQTATDGYLYGTKYLREADSGGPYVFVEVKLQLVESDSTVAAESATKGAEWQAANAPARPA